MELVADDAEEEGGVKVMLSRDEALVLFDWLTRFNAKPQAFADQAEQRVLWDLQCLLESTLVEPLRKSYPSLLAEARRRTRDSSDDDG